MSGNTDDVFDDLLEKIADEIYGNEDVKKLGKKLGFNPANIARFNEENARQGGSSMGTLNMLRKWRQKQNVKEEKKNLKAALESSDFAHFINDFLSADDVEQQPSHASPVSTVQGASSLPPSEEGYEEVEPDGEGYYNQKMKQATPSEQQLDLEKNYKMDALKKGHMFILNMSEDRQGSDVDVKNIKHVFGEIGYKIKPHSDLTAEKLTDELEEFAKSSCHEDMCSAVYFFMGHGTKTGIKCSDKEVTYDVISNKVSETKYMNGKPKMIFFQSCRGGQHEERVETDQADTKTEIPAKSDVFMVYATTDGFYDRLKTPGDCFAENFAYRNTVRGAWFVQMLCEELLENAHVSDLSTMLEQVTQKVGKMVYKKRDSKDKKLYGQSPVVVKQGISKKIYFLPKYCSEE